MTSRSWLALLFVGACADPGARPPPPSPPPPPPPPSVHCHPGSVLVAGGSFWMGSPDGVGADDQHPRHPVTLATFCLDRTEVTVTAYAACAAAGGCPPPPKPYRACNANFADRGDHPMNCIDWTEARSLCAWTGGRLPTEAEWEYAARGQDERTYPWGDAPPDADRVNGCGADCAAYLAAQGHPRTSTLGGVDGYVLTAPVGSYPRGASAFGALDMGGNVAEWIEDRYVAYAPGATCAVEGDRVIRGGDWASADPWVFGAARRWADQAGYRSVELGVRCARAVEP